jgi:hypothetical protein
MGNRVGYLASTLKISRHTPVNRRSELNVSNLMMDKSFMEFQDSSNGVDQSEQSQDIKARAGFAIKTYCKKRYKANFIILDFMTLNSFITNPNPEDKSEVK